MPLELWRYGFREGNEVEALGGETASRLAETAVRQRRRLGLSDAELCDIYGQSIQLTARLNDRNKASGDCRRSWHGPSVGGLRCASVCPARTPRSARTPRRRSDGPFKDRSCA